MGQCVVPLHKGRKFDGLQLTMLHHHCPVDHGVLGANWSGKQKRRKRIMQRTGRTKSYPLQQHRLPCFAQHVGAVI